MKKTIALLLSALLLLSVLSGCGAKQPEEAPKTTETPAPAPAPVETTPAPTETPAPETYSPDGSVLFEKDGIKVTTAGLDLDPTSTNEENIIWVDIENAGKEDVCLGVANGSVNGFMGTVVLIEYYEEDGEYYGANNCFNLTIPAESSGRYALGYYRQDTPGVDMDTLAELEFCFTLAEDEFTWPDYYSEPVVILTGETVEAADIASIGTVVLDNDKLLLVIGEQDYDDWFGPYVYTYAENRSDRFVGISADAAEADGTGCEDLYYGEQIAPGKKSAGRMSFDGDIREMKGFENLTVTFTVFEAETSDELGSGSGTTLDPITVTYPPQNWGEYENGGLRMEIRPKINDLITVETPENDENGVLFSVSETASLEAGGYEGAGWLFSIGKISEEKLCEMLCYDMSGAEAFAKDEDGNYYMLYHPTDVRYERATVEEMKRDAAQWSMLCEWAADMPDVIREQNGLESVSFDNSEVAMYVARAAWLGGANVTLSTTEYGPVETKDTDGTPYAQFVMQGWFGEADPEETPDGEYVVLNLPDENVRLDFFFAPGAYVRVVSGEDERLYRAGWFDDNISYAEAMQGWYYAAAEGAGVKPADGRLKSFCGDWHEKYAGRGVLSISRSVAPGKAKIEASWPESAAVMDTWKLLAVLDEDGRLAYENGSREVIEFDEDGEGWTTDWSDEESGWFELRAGELIWHDDRVEGGEDSVFVR